MTSYDRAEIGLRPPAGRTKLDLAKVEGVALHWPAMPKPLTRPVDVMEALRGWQEYHMEGHGWSDIAYQVAIDQAGNWYQLRGLRHRSAANGDQDVNERYGAFLLVLAEGEEPTAAMVATTQARIARFQHLFRHGLQIVGHQDVRPDPTTCPGPRVMALIHRDAFEPRGDHQ